MAFPDSGGTATGGGAGQGQVGNGGAGGARPLGGSGGAGGGRPPGGNGGGQAVTDGGLPIIDAAPPAPTNTVLFAGEALLLAPGLACSHPPAAAAGAPAPDKWCGIVRVNAAQTGLSLSVINVTKALAGTAITCAASDPNCVVVNPSISDPGSDADALHGFYGQTLVYYDAQGVYAWRPGWTAGRLLIARTSTQPAQCFASSADAMTAICIQLDVTGTSINSYIGSIATQAGAVLPALESLGSASRIRFSPDAQSVLWSVNTSTTGGLGETLRMQTIGNDASRKTIATNVRSWIVSADSTRFFWSSAPSMDANGFVTGTLQTAPYPAGTPPVSLQGKVFSANFAPFGTKGMVSLSTPTATGTDLKTIADVDNPTTTTTVIEAQDVFFLLDVAADGTILYSNDFVQPDPNAMAILVNLRSVKASGTGKCAVNAMPSADPGVSSFTRSGTGVISAEVLLDTSNTVTAVNGQVTTLADCAPHPFSSSFFGSVDVTTGLVVQENFDGTASTADLSFGLFSAAGAVNPAMKIQAAADVTIEALLPETPKVVFTINGRAMGNGVYASPTLTGLPAADVAPTPAARPPSVSPRALSAWPGLFSSSISPSFLSQARTRALAPAAPYFSAPSAATPRISLSRRFDGGDAQALRAFTRGGVPLLLRR